MRSFFCQPHVSRCQMASRVVVSAVSLRRTFTFSVRRSAPRLQIRSESPYGFEWEERGVNIRRHGRPEVYWDDSLSSDELGRF